MNVANDLNKMNKNVMFCNTLLCTDLSVHDIIENICPRPKASALKRKRRSKKSEILTNTPVKNSLTVSSMKKSKTNLIEKQLANSLTGKNCKNKFRKSGKNIKSKIGSDQAAEDDKTKGRQTGYALLVRKCIIILLSLI